MNFTKLKKDFFKKILKINKLLISYFHKHDLFV